MSTVYQNLVETWRNCPLDYPPYILPQDVIGDSVTYTSYEEYCRHIGVYTPTQFHVGLLPQPYFGNLETAKIFVLTLNPGLSAAGYYSEYTIPVFRNALENSLRQESFDEDFPFIFLNPDFAGYGGFEYWHKRLRTTLEWLAEKVGSYREALSQFSKRFAVLELIPYHSEKSDRHKRQILSNLRSSSLAIDFVHQDLLPRAHRSEILLIAVRARTHWRLEEESESVVLYRGAQSIGAYLGIGSPGGEAIIDFLTNHPHFLG
jgi:hypothetical protein